MILGDLITTIIIAAMHIHSVFGNLRMLEVGTTHALYRHMRSVILVLGADGGKGRVLLGKHSPRLGLLD